MRSSFSSRQARPVTALLGLAAALLVACEQRGGPLPTEPEFARTTHAMDVVVLLDPSDAGAGHLNRKASAAAVARGLGLQATHTYGTALYGFATSLPAGQVESLPRRDPRVLAVYADEMATTAARLQEYPGGAPQAKGGSPDKGPRVKEDPCVSEPPQDTGWGVTRVGGSSDATGRTVWILDTGIDLDHCDLNVDVGRSVTFINDGRNRGHPATPDDRNGHGTIVAGIVGAIDNEIGAVGVAAGATLVSVRVLNADGFGSYSAIAAGVDYVAANAAPGDVANMSLRGRTHSDFLHQAVENAASRGILFSIAAGNDTVDASISTEPAHVEHPNVYTVSAIDSLDALASFSNFGNPPVDFAAPGVDVLSILMGGGVKYTALGTSMAAPHVAGLLADGGTVGFDGFAVGDPDGIPDPIAHR